jgi:hypothetical protein
VSARRRRRADWPYRRSIARTPLTPVRPNNCRMPYPVAGLRRTRSNKQPAGGASGQDAVGAG